MTKVNDDDLDEKPLDPEMEKVRRKMVRLLAVSIGVMFIGLMAVLGAIVYKIHAARCGAGRWRPRRRVIHGGAVRCAAGSSGSFAGRLHH